MQLTSPHRRLEHQTLGPTAAGVQVQPPLPAAKSTTRSLLHSTCEPPTPGWESLSPSYRC